MICPSFSVSNNLVLFCNVLCTLKNYLTRLGDIGDKEEQQIEQLIANISTSPNPTELIATANRIAEISDIPLSELEERIRVLKSEKEALERAIEEGRTIIESVNLDRKMVEDYKVMNTELEKCGVSPQEPRKFHNLLRVLRMNNYDYAKILNTFADINDARKLRLGADNEWRILRARLEQIKDTLPFAEQLSQYGVGISEVFAFMLAVDEKADMERTSRGAPAYRVIEELRDYSQLGGLKKELNRMQQQLFMSNVIMTTRQQALVSLMRLQASGVTDMEIKNMARLMDFDSILKENNNGNTTNNGWSTF